jgi:hypothetical protein
MVQKAPTGAFSFLFEITCISYISLLKIITILKFIVSANKKILYNGKYRWFPVQIQYKGSSLWTRIHEILHLVNGFRP